MCTYKMTIYKIMHVHTKWWHGIFKTCLMVSRTWSKETSASGAHDVRNSEVSDMSYMSPHSEPEAPNFQFDLVFWVPGIWWTKKYSTTHQRLDVQVWVALEVFWIDKKQPKRIWWNLGSDRPSVSVWPWDLGFYWGSLKKARAQTKGCSHLSKRNELMFAWCFYLEDAFKFCFFFVSPPNLWDTDTVMIKLPQKILTSFASPPPKYSILSFKFVDDKIFHLTPPRWRLQTSIWSRGDFTAFNHHLSPLQLGAASMKPMVGRNGRPFNWKIRWEYGRFSLKFGDIFLFLFEHFNI